MLLKVLNNQKLIVSLSWFSVIVLLFLIFLLSSQTAMESSSLSMKTSEMISESIVKVASNSDINIKTFNSKLRESGHFFIYFLLAIFVSRAMFVSRMSGFKVVLLSFIICITLAILDEIHQIFVTPKHRKVGYARRLLDELSNLFPEKSFYARPVFEEEESFFKNVRLSIVQ